MCCGRWGAGRGETESDWEAERGRARKRDQLQGVGEAKRGTEAKGKREGETE